MKILIPFALALLCYLALLRIVERVFGWSKKPSRIHALALIIWLVLFGLVQAGISSLLPPGGVSQYEIAFVMLVVTLLNFLALRLLYKESPVSTGILVSLQSVLFSFVAYVSVG
jgi:hypothetical protein